MRFARQIFVFSLALLLAAQFALGHLAHESLCQLRHDHRASCGHSHASRESGASACRHNGHAAIVQSAKSKDRLTSKREFSPAGNEKHSPHDAGACAICRALMQAQDRSVQPASTASVNLSIDRLAGGRQEAIVRSVLLLRSRGPPAA